MCCCLASVCLGDGLRYGLSPASPRTPPPSPPASPTSRHTTRSLSSTPTTTSRYLSPTTGGCLGLTDDRLSGADMIALGFAAHFSMSDGVQAAPRRHVPLLYYYGAASSL